MIDSSIFILRTLPAVVGILATAYSAFLIMRLGRHFFRVVTGWAVVLLMTSLIIVWGLEIWEEFVGEFPENRVDMIRAGFIIGTSWLGVGIISMTTYYGRYSEAKVFGVWVLKSPLNLITIFGAGGLAVFVAAILSLAGRPANTFEGWLLAIMLTYILLCALTDAILPIASARRGRLAVSKEGRLQIAVFAVSWMGIPSAEFALSAVPGISSYLGELNPVSWILVLLFIAMMYIIFTTRLIAIIVDPEVETSRRAGFRSFDIPRGVYLIYDDEPESAFGLFSELVTHPLRPDAMVPGAEDSPTATLSFLIPMGLVMTREYPETIRERYRLQVTPIIWLTESPGERRIAPTSLAMATDTIVHFMDANPNSIVLLEGLEYLITFNDFKKVLKALDSLNETAWITKGRLMIAINPHAFEEKELALLERDRIVLRGNAGIEELKRESKVLAESA